MPVAGFDVTFSRPLADAKSWGDVGPYEELRGTLHFAVDPGHSANERITDVELAPRIPTAKFDFSANVLIIFSVDRSKASGKMMLNVVNRGNRVAFPNFNCASRPTIDSHTPIKVEVDASGHMLEFNLQLPDKQEPA